jgi:hypothetical protein
MTYDVTAEERNQISQGLYSYCRGLDRFDRDLALSPFAAESHLVYSGIFDGTASEFMDWIWPIHGRMLAHVHRVVNVFIERTPHGDLVSEAYVQVLLRTTAEDGAITDNIGNGRYVDRWIQRDGHLVIAERDYVRDATRTYPHEQTEQSAVRPAASVGTLTWARDESDASYRMLRA